MAAASVAATAPLAGCATPSATSIAGVNTQIAVGITALATYESGLADAITAGRVSKAAGAENRVQITKLRNTLLAVRAAGGVDTDNVLPATLTAIAILQATLKASP